MVMTLLPYDTSAAAAAEGRGVWRWQGRGQAGLHDDDDGGTR